MNDETVTGFAEQVLSTEHRALDRWCAGDPMGYVDVYASDGTYFDPAVDQRLDSRAEIDAYVRPLIGKIYVDRYEM